MSLIDTTNLLLQTTIKIFDFLPNYDQKKKNDLLKLEDQYSRELSRDYKFRDDNRIDYLRDKINIYVRSFIHNLKEEVSDD